MSPSGAVILCSVVFCAGAWLVATGWGQPRPRLDRAMAHLRRPATVTAAPTGNASSTATTIGSFVERRSSTTWTRAWAQPLRLVGRSVEEHVGYLVLAALAGLVVPALAARRTPRRWCRVDRPVDPDRGRAARRRDGPGVGALDHDGGECRGHCRPAPSTRRLPRHGHHAARREHRLRRRPRPGRTSR